LINNIISLFLNNEANLKSFIQWLEQSTLGTEMVDERQIDSAYDKAKFAVKLVQMYDETLPRDQKLLLNISTIATLNKGVYGMYSSAEDKKVIGANVVGKIRMKFGDDFISSQKINTLPSAVIKKYIPDVDLNQIKSSDVIHINVQKHLQSHGDTLECVLELASTIVHECTHELERQKTGTTSEVGPVKAEGIFMQWVKRNWKTITTRIPQIASIPKKDINA